MLFELNIVRNIDGLLFLFWCFGGFSVAEFFQNKIVKVGFGGMGCLGVVLELDVLFSAVLGDEIAPFLGYFALYYMTHILNQINKCEFGIQDLFTVQLQHLISTHIIQLMIVNELFDSRVVYLYKIKILN